MMLGPGPGGDPRAVAIGGDSGSESDADGDGCGCCPKNSGKDRNGYVDDKNEPGYVNHRCTDLLCLLIFFAALFGMGVVLNYARENGDLRRLYHGYDFLGELCGVKELNADGTVLYDNADKPFLYYCKMPCEPNPLDLTDSCAKDEATQTWSKLNFLHPVCRSGCPQTSVGLHPCYNGTVPGPKINENADTGSFARTMQYQFELVNDYPSKTLLHAYCIPEDEKMLEDLMNFIRKQPAMQMVMEAMSLENGWPLLLFAAVFAIILGFVYLWLLNKLACCLVYGSMVILCTVPMVAGGLLCYAYTLEDGLDGLPGTGDRMWDLVIGIACLVMGLIFVAISFCLASAIDTAIRVVQATSECIMDLPSLLFEPVIKSVFRLLVMSGLFYGMLYLLSCGTISTLTLEEFAMISNSASINGVFRTFTYTQEEWYFIMYYTFMILWVMCMVTAVSQFALAYAVQYWYFTPYEANDEKDLECCPVLRGYRVGIFFHLGSMAFGSFIIACLMFVRMILAFIAKQAQDSGNPAGAALAKALSCCVHCFQRCLEFLNKNAYMDIALNSTSYCFAARNAVNIIVKNFPEIAILNGACWVFEMAGIGAITAGGTALVWVCVKNIPQFAEIDSEWYIADPIGVLVVAGFVCFTISYAFLNVYDMVADTVLYCKCNEEIRRRKGTLNAATRYAPRKLDKLVRGQDPGSDTD